MVRYSSPPITVGGVSPAPMSGRVPLTALEVNVAVETESGRRMLDVGKVCDRIDDSRVVPGPLAEARIIKPD